MKLMIVNIIDNFDKVKLSQKVKNTNNLTNVDIVNISNQGNCD